MKVKENINVLPKDEIKLIAKKSFELMNEFIISYCHVLSRKKEYNPFCFDCFSKRNEEYFNEREAFIEELTDNKARKKCLQLTHVESLLAETLDSSFPNLNTVAAAKDALNSIHEIETNYHIIRLLSRYLDDVLDEFVTSLLSTSYEKTYEFDEETLNLKRDDKEIASFSYDESESYKIKCEFKTDDIIDVYYIRFYFSDFVLLFLKFKELKSKLLQLNQDADIIHQTYLECNMD